MQSEHASFETPRETRNRSVYERFAIPYVFSPNLSLGEAALAAMGAFARIFLGSVLFALWGVLIALVWNSIASDFWRVVVSIPLVLVFVATMAGLMLGITAIGNMICPRTQK